MVLSLPVLAEESAILGYFKDRSYWVNLPKGFYQEPKAAARIGATFLLLPDGYHFNNAPAVIYSSVYANETVEAAVQHDEARFMRGSKDMVVTKAQKLQSKDGKVILVKAFIDPSSMQQPFESVAYIQEGESVVTLVVSAFNKLNYEVILPDYLQMLETYESADVKVVHKN